MANDDLKLLFETERQILARRLRRLFPTGLQTSRDPARSRGSRSRRSGPAPDRAPQRRRATRRGSRPAFTACVSILLHGVLLALFLPDRPPAAAPSKPPAVEIRWVPRLAKKAPTPAPAPPAIPEPTPEVVEPAPEVAADPAPQPTARVTPVPAPEPARVEASEHGLAGAPVQSAPTAGGEYGSRGAGRAEAVRRYGGSEATESAVAAGLQWLLEHQDGDGSWGPDTFHLHCEGAACRGSGFPEYRVGVTGLATLALLASLSALADEQPPARAIRRALDYLLSAQDESGCYGPRTGNYMYNHAIAAFCVAEAAALTREERLRNSAERALSFSAQTQQPGGGWDYTSARTLRNDLSITGWQVMAIHAARRAGIFYPEEMEQRVRHFVRRAAPPSGWATYADRGIGEGRGGVSIAAVGMLSKLYLGWSPGSPEITRTAELLVRQPPNDASRVDWERTFQSSYYWYYATLALFHVGGDTWEAWNVWIQRTILPLQRTRDHREGSWDPDPNWLGAAGGRVATTALNVLTLEVYYRYAPLAKRYGLEEKK
ncbi:MAG: hypothetical protein AB7O52_00675 [Planctomycetota bacterium]